MPETTFAALASCWPIGPCRELPGLTPAGSPERVKDRMVLQQLQAPEGKFVLEGCSPGQSSRRWHQAEILSRLAASGCPLLSPWLRSREGAWGVQLQGLFWQLRPWLEGKELPRETYGQDRWRGEAMAQFLLRLHQAAPALDCDCNCDCGCNRTFRLQEYIGRMLPRLKVRNPALHTDLLPVWSALRDFRLAENALPAAFCHGDFHPLNVLWGDAGLNGVIDWEFLGRKTEMYDAANLLGCLGMDDPAFLTGDMARGLVITLARANMLSPESWHWLPDCVAALRFAWMREWCWRNNQALIIQELDFLGLLLDNRDFLRRSWQSWRDSPPAS
ncbi:MAG: phosphotransferase [Oligosphaeraceae bacterium]|nr:phosphotransferase [Oligosphaeraceae bacterium]